MTSFNSPPTVTDVTRTDGYTSYTGGCSGGVVTTRHGYDPTGNSITATDPNNHLGCHSNQYSACATYDGFGAHLLTATNAKNQTTTYDYDQDAPEAGYGEWLMSETDPNGQTTTYTYDALGRLTSVIRPGDSLSSPTLTYTYINTCSPGQTKPCLEIDTATRFTQGGRTSTERAWYDGWGHLVETQTPGPNLFSKVPLIPSALVSYTIYDSMGQQTYQSLNYAVPAPPGQGYVIPDLYQPRTKTFYDSLGRTTGTITYSFGSHIIQQSTTQYTIAQGVPTIPGESGTYYEQALTLDAYSHQSITYTDGFGRTRYSQAYSGMGNSYSVLRTVGTTYDPVGNTLSVTTYDSAGASQATYNATYDGLKRLTGYNDSDLGSCANTPMPADCKNPSDNAWQYAYDADSNQLSQTDPRNQSRYTSYDNIDRPLCSALTSGDATACSGSTDQVYFYDGYSNASTPNATFPAGCTAPGGSYASDPIGRKTAEIFIGASGAGSGWRCEGYDQRGQTDQSMLSVTTPDTTTVTQTVNMSYNDGGEMSGLVYPDGETLTSTYDVNGRLHSIYFGAPSSPDPVPFLVGKVSYTNNGQVTSLAMGGSGPKNSVPTALFSSVTQYDNIQRPQSDSLTESGQTLWSQARSYDNVGNVLGLSTVVPTQGGGSATENESFCYDALNRLTWAGNSGTPGGSDHCGPAPTGTTLPTYQQAYTYDSLDRISSAGTVTYSYGNLSHVHAVTSLSSIPTPYAAYDAMGNMTCRNTDTTGGHTCGTTPNGAAMSYDSRSQLASWSAPSGTVGSASYLYDNQGTRVLTHSTSASSSSNTIYFDGYTETVLSGLTTTTSKYYSVNGARVAVKVSGALDYLASDPLGSNTVALNSAGQVIALQHYSPYGSVDYSWGTMPTSYSYADQRLDSQTGLLYDSFRYYDPLTGRYVRSDNVQDNSSGMDPYAYVGDNPETRNDPSGHCWPLCTIILGAVIGAAFSVATTVASDAVQGKTPTLGEIAQSAVVGALTGAITGALGPEAGPAARIAVGALASGVGQMAGNAMSGKPLMDGVGQAVVTGAITGGLVEGAGALFKGVGSKIVSSLADESSSTFDSLASDICSFTPGTLVETNQGKQAIGKLHTGDKVLSYNPKTHKMEVEPVVHVWINHDHDLIDLTITSPIPSQHGKSGTQTREVIHTTSKHPFLTMEHGFLPVAQLTIGMRLLRADGSVGVITGWKMVPGTMVMYNLEVARDHTFTVGDDEWIVHNSCRSSLRTNLKLTDPAQQAHHVIPFDLRSHDLVVASEMDINNAMNGRAMFNNQLDAQAVGEAYHSGSHPQYSAFIERLLNSSYKNLLGNGTFAQPTAMDAMQQVINYGNAFIDMWGPGRRLE